MTIPAGPTLMPLRNETGPAAVERFNAAIPRLHIVLDSEFADLRPLQKGWVAADREHPLYPAARATRPRRLGRPFVSDFASAELSWPLGL